jgi:2-dehydropantoate 2-reductase
MMRIAIFGVGGVGGYFGGRLADAGREVVLIARGAHRAAIESDGLRIESPKGNLVVRPALVTDRPADVGPVDLVIVGVKTWQLDEAAEAMRPLVGPGTTILPLLNGVEAPGRLASVLGREGVLGGLCRVLASLDGPGRIVHTGLEPTIVLGEMAGRQSPRSERVRDVLVEAGIRTELPADIRVAMWEKFMLIATWSGIGAVTRVPIGVWRTLPETRELAGEGLAEVLRVGQARGIDLAEETVLRTMKAYDATPGEGIASMQRDIMADRPSELEAQSGAVVRLGAAVGVRTPVHTFLHRALLPQELAARG